jgi:hypothetical protein
MPIKISDKGSPTEERIKQKKHINTTPSDSGLMHADNGDSERGPQYKTAPNEKIFSKNNAYIVLGTDRPSSMASGYGAKGSNRAATIDLVAGRMSSARGGKGVKDLTHVDNNFAADAARVYISQLTDIDTNFGIVEGSIGNIKGRSAVGIKADGVRVFGREGVKIVTGRGNNWKGFGLKGETNSLGGKISQPAPGIELIAGNNTEPRKVWGGIANPVETIETLQPIAMGYNTRDAFRELGEIIEEILGALINLGIVQMSVNSATAAAFASSGVYPPHSVAAGVIGSANSALIPTSVMNPLYHARVNKTMWEFNHLTPFGYKFICSRSVKST